QLQRFHDSLSALSWAEGVTNSLCMLEHLEIVRSEPPTVLAFCLDPPSMSMLQDVSEILRIEHRRFSLVCPDTMPDRGRVPQRIRTVWLREDAPQELFQDLTL
ncbi:MAG: hypothetical protein K9N51_09460, partial [Candidatus Pacebacteria bacterium]|nr:hypothetical protein [Candidatus Paceibacterota bacterium]